MFNPYVVIFLLVGWIGTAGYAFYQGYEYSQLKIKYQDVQDQLLISEAKYIDLENLIKARDEIDQKVEKEMTDTENKIDDLQKKIDALPDDGTVCVPAGFLRDLSNIR